MNIQGMDPDKIKELAMKRQQMIDEFHQLHPTCPACGSGQIMLTYISGWHHMVTARGRCRKCKHKIEVTAGYKGNNL